MKTPHISLLLNLVSTLVVCSVICRREATWEGPAHYFQIPVSVNTLKKTYKINDTIMLETVVNGTTLFDTVSKQAMNLDTGYIDFSVYYRRLGVKDSDPVTNHCMILFDSIWSYTMRDKYGYFHYNDKVGCAQPGFRSIVGFKAVRKGIYAIQLRQYLQLGSCPQKRKRYVEMPYEFTFQDSDLGIEILETQYRAGNIGKEEKEALATEIKNRRAFAFVVE